MNESFQFIKPKNIKRPYLHAKADVLHIFYPKSIHLGLFSKKSLKSENHSGQIKPSIINVHLEPVQKVYLGFMNDVTTDTNVERSNATKVKYFYPKVHNLPLNCVIKMSV